MNDLLSYFKAVVGFLILLVTGLFGWTLTEHVKRLRALEENSVRKEDLNLLRSDMEDRHEERKAELLQLRTDMESRHRENSGKLDVIGTGVTRTHERIDDLYRDFLSRSER